MFINYAHRGASAYEPENTIESFRLGLEMGANGIETDIHRTKDGVLVLFHDDTLMRVTGAPGRVQDYTYDELSVLNVNVQGKSGRIPRLRDFLTEFADRDITFAIEFKQEFTERETIDMLREFNLARKTVLTSFNLNCLMRARLYGPEFRLGYLTKDVNELTLPVMRTIGITEVCPNANIVTPELVRHLHAEGFNVRAYGIKDEMLMKSVFDAGVDGMTVNFPDKLHEYMLLGNMH
ncbi:MAG: hypothetical protein IJM90_09370 [Firmicutes bacterium]|nr:hypothetical protein [Bacillota bacterium]